MTANPVKAVFPMRIADALAHLRHVFIRDLVLTCSIGVHKHERKKPQRVRFNVDLGVLENDQPLRDDLANVVCYEEIATGIRGIVASGHVNLVETLAEDVASMCLQDPRIRSVRVRVEKLDIFSDATSVGVEIERFNAAS